MAWTPHPQLRPALARPHTGYTEVSHAHQLVVPATAAVPVIVRVHDSVDRAPTFVMGVHDTYTVMVDTCAPSYLEVWLAPLGAYTILGLPMDELRGETLDLGEILGAAGVSLANRIRDARSWTERFELMDEFLLRQVERGPRPSPEVSWAWQRLVATGGTAPIGRIADDVGWSHKHLITKFRQEVGLTPKTAARLVRLDNVWRRIDQRRDVRWDEIAAESGYADQAHLVRDFRQFTGTTPTHYITEVEAVQDELLSSSAA
jgi:AraC-like DNA-binding protein